MITVVKILNLAEKESAVAEHLNNLGESATVLSTKADLVEDEFDSIYAVESIFPEVDDLDLLFSDPTYVVIRS